VGQGLTLPHKQNALFYGVNIKYKTTTTTTTDNNNNSNKF
jgi:hypothetical protein